MKKALPVLFVVFLASFTQVSPAAAHPADIYTHSIYVTLAQDRLSIKWEIKPGPMLVSYIWYEADSNKDNIISPAETEKWASSFASQFTATLEHARFPLRLDNVQFPSSLDNFQSGAETITIRLSAAWPKNTNDAYELVLYNGVEESKSLSWYYVTAQDNLKFPLPEQKNNLITIQVFKPAAQALTQFPLRTDWDSSMPSFSQQQGTATLIPDQPTSSLLNFLPTKRTTSQDILLNLVRTEKFSVLFYIYALVVSLVLGALHALTPGHGKTVVAAYLVGSRGTKWHAMALGTVVTLTHTGSVFLLGIITLLASQYILPTTLIPIFEIISGLLIVGLGSYLLRQRYQAWRKTKIPAPNNTARKYSLKPAIQAKLLAGGIKVKISARPFENDQHYHDHGDGYVHSHDMPEAITWRSLIALGISGGLVPCPDAIAILLVAVAINRILLGLTLIISFSLGLAIVLISIGLLMVSSRRLFDRISIFDKVAPILPMASALVVLTLGIVLTGGAVAQAKDGFNLTGAGSGSINDAQILYLAGGQEQIKQLYVAKIHDSNPVLLSVASENVVEFALAPDKTKVLYITQTENLENKLWLMDLNNWTKKNLSDCNNAICSRPAWSPDGKQIVYEYLPITGADASGLINLRWLNIETGETGSVFQESKLPGASPRWSPDGKWLSYATTEDLRLYNFSTGENHIIKTILGVGADWSPDSKKVLYRDVILQGRQFATQLFVYDLSSRSATNISPDPRYENNYAAWSPDGKWIAVIRRDLSVPRGDQIWLMSADGSQARALTENPNELHGDLKWSADGKYLLYDVSFFESSSSDEPSIQILAVETGKITDLQTKGYRAEWLLP